MQLRDKKYMKNKGLPKYFTGWELPKLTQPNINLQQYGIQPNYSIPQNYILNRPDWNSVSLYNDGYGNGYGQFQSKLPSLMPQKQQQKQQTDPNPPGAIGSQGLGPWGAIAEIAATNAKGFINEFSYQPTSSYEILSNQNRTTSSVGGISYTKIDTSIDKDDYLDHWSAKNIANDFLSGNLGAALGKTMGHGRDKQLKEIEKAEKEAKMRNEASYNNAYNEYLRNNEMLERAKYGRDAKTDNMRYGKNKIVNTAYGKAYLPQNAWVSKNERIVDTLTGNSYSIKNGSNDTAPAFLRGRDAVLTNSSKKELLNPETGNTFAKDFYAYANSGNLQHLLDLQRFVHQRNGINNSGNYVKAELGLNAGDIKRVDNGRIPEIKPWEVILSRLPQLASAYAGFIDARKQPVSRINSYVPNRYAGMALPILAGLRVNSSPVLRDIDNKYNSYVRQLNSQYSLTAGQKQLYQLAAMYNSQMAKAMAIYDSQIQNNKYNSDFASTALSLGAKDAENRISTSQYDKQYYDKAISAKNKVIDSYLADIYKSSGAVVSDLMNSRILNAMLNRYQA